MVDIHIPVHVLLAISFDTSVQSSPVVELGNKIRAKLFGDCYVNRAGCIGFWTRSQLDRGGTAKSTYPKHNVPGRRGAVGRSHTSRFLQLTHSADPAAISPALCFADTRQRFRSPKVKYYEYLRAFYKFFLK
jgi:hypothetical protein